MNDCPYHEKMQDKISECETDCEVLKKVSSMNEEKMKDLTEKYDVLQKTLVEQGVRLERIDTKQDSILEKIEVFCKTSTEMENKMVEYDKFTWFRTWVNNMRDNLPKFIFYFILIIIGMLAIINNISIKDVLKGILEFIGVKS